MMLPFKTASQTAKSMKFTQMPLRNVFAKMVSILSKEVVEHANLLMDINMMLPFKDVSGCVVRMKFSSINNAFAKRDSTE